MGGNVSAENEIDNKVSAMVDVYNETSQNCSPTASINQVMNFVAPPGCATSSIDVRNIQMKAIVQMDVQCAQKAAASAEVNTKIDQIAQQMAEAVSQNLSFNPGDTNSKNISRMCINVASAVKNSVAQTIASAAQASQVINVTGYCVVNFRFITMDAYIKSFAKGIQESEQVAKAVTELKQTISQSATSKQENALVMIIILIIVLVGVGGQAAIKPALTYGIPVAGGLYGMKLIMDYKKGSSTYDDSFKSRFVGGCCGAFA